MGAKSFPIYAPSALATSLNQRTWERKQDLQYAISNLLPSNNLERITPWIIVWPFSVIENLLGDVITAIQGLVTRVFKGVYYKIFVAQTAALRDRVETFEK